MPPLEYSFYDLVLALGWPVLLFGCVSVLPFAAAPLVSEHLFPRMPLRVARPMAWWLGAVIALVAPVVLRPALYPALWRLNGSGPGDAEGRGFTGLFLVVLPALGTSALCTVGAVVTGATLIDRERGAGAFLLVTATGAATVALAALVFFAPGAL
jgi:hypothetical protein